MNPTILIGLAGTICSIAFAYIGYLKGTKKESHVNGAESGMLLTEMKHMTKLLEELQKGQRETTKALSALVERVVRNEETIKRAVETASMVKELREELSALSLKVQSLENRIENIEQKG